MTMNAKSIGPVVTATVLGGAPAGVMIGAARHANKTIGAPASLAHVLTNDKLDNKAKVLAEQTKEGIKDTLTLGGIALGTGAAASLATGCSNKVATAFKGLKGKLSGILGNMNYGGKSVKDMIKNTNVFKKFNSLPAPAKVGLAVGAAALALAAPIVSMVSAQKAGYIEGQHEVK